MIAEAIAVQLPHVKNISVDLQTIRWSDPATGYRYIYLTPRDAQEMLIAFDQGWDHLIKPIVFELRNPQITPMRKTVVDPKTGQKKQTPSGKTRLQKADRQGTGGTFIRMGGQTPPLGPLANGGYGARFGKRRTFGLKGLRKPFDDGGGEAVPA
jgi:hypothetical protein